MTSFKIKPFFKSYGAQVVAQDESACLMSFSSEWVNKELAKSGVIIFKNFTVDLDLFTRFIAKHSRRVTNDPARKASSSNAQLIEAGDVEMGLHIENGNLLWK